jgi:hypothetical protein
MRTSLVHRTKVSVRAEFQIGNHLVPPYIVYFYAARHLLLGNSQNIGLITVPPTPLRRHHLIPHWQNRNKESLKICKIPTRFGRWPTIGYLWIELFYTMYFDESRYVLFCVMAMNMMRFDFDCEIKIKSDCEVTVIARSKWRRGNRESVLPSLGKLLV